MEDKDFLHRQLIKLGDMMGDGLHHEPGGKWISREYRQISRILYPEIKEAEAKQRKLRNKAIDESISKKLETDSCGKCNSPLKQSRSGSKVVICKNEQCGARYRYRPKK